MDKQYRVCYILTPNAIITSACDKVGEPRDTGKIFRSKLEAQSSVASSNRSQAQDFGIGEEKIYYYLKEEDIPKPDRIWIRLDRLENKITSGQDTAMPFQSGWKGMGKGTYFADGYSYPEVLRRLADFIEKQDD